MLDAQDRLFGFSSTTVRCVVDDRVESTRDEEAHLAESAGYCGKTGDPEPLLHPDQPTPFR